MKKKNKTGAEYILEYYLEPLSIKYNRSNAQCLYFIELLGSVEEWIELEEAIKKLSAHACPGDYYECQFILMEYRVKKRLDILFDEYGGPPIKVKPKKIKPTYIPKPKNFLEFAEETALKMSWVPAREFSKYYIDKKIESFRLYHYYGKDNEKCLITSTEHGIDFFHNVIKYWDDPDSYCENPKDKSYVNYKYNFVTLLKINKEDSGNAKPTLIFNDKNQLKYRYK